MKEIELIKQAQQGDRRAFSALYGKYKEPLYRYARYRLGSGPDAEDAVSDCILEVWKRLPTLREPAAFRAFAFRILSACCARQIRLQIDRRTKSDIDAPGVAQDASLVLRHVAGKTPLNDNVKKAADVNGDGEVTAQDASLILQKVAGKISESEWNK
jgi:RNA polymerase sigma factor (sigma-70 family)